MTDRDTFAAAALTGFIRGMPSDSIFHVGLMAKQSYEVADAMLRERNTAPHPTLTDEERDAVKLAADFLEDEFYGCSDKCAAEHNAVATLRKLLWRLK